MSAASRVVEIAAPPAPAGADAAGADDAVDAVERGDVLLLRPGFALNGPECELLSPACSDGRAKNVSYDPTSMSLRGSALEDAQRALLASMLERYCRHARLLVDTLLPRYTPHLRWGLTSYRPFEVEGRAASVIRDDTRLHVDAFASRPVHGLRILRVFSNINPDGRPRVWEIGGAFDDIVARYAPRLARPLPGSAWLLNALRITKQRRSEYDHLMLGLHDSMKRDSAYQESAPRTRVEFAAGSTWICFSDRVAHAALSGQYMLEQTFYLPVDAMRHESLAPLRVLERIYRRKLA